MILSISGPKGGGKDTVGKIIQILLQWNEQGNYTELTEETIDNCCSILKDYSSPQLVFRKQMRWEIKKFADKLKEVASLLTGIAKEDFEKEDIKNMTFRQLCEKGYITKEFLDGLPD